MITRALFGRASLLAVVSLLLFGAHGGEDSAVATAKSFVTTLAAEKIADAARFFDKGMASALPVENLKDVWKGLQAANGTFKKMGRIRVESVGPHTVVFVACHFQKAQLDAKVVVSGAGRVTGLWFVPLTVDWIPPPYAETSAFSEQAVTVGNAPWTLPGILAVPRHRGPHPAVVLVHGSGPNDMDETVAANKPFKDLAFGLASRGIAVLRYDKRTKVYSQQLFDKVTQFTINDETVDDAVAAVHLLFERPEIDRRRVFVLGHSLGGMAAPRIAQKAPRLAGLIVLAGNTRPFGDILVEQVSYNANLDGKVDEAEKREIEKAKTFRTTMNDPALKPGTMVDFLGSKIPGSYWIDLRAYNPPQVAASLDMPMLVVQGGRDWQVTLDDFDGWKNILGVRPRIMNLKS